MTIPAFPHSGEGPLIRLYQMPPEDIGFLTSLVEAYEGIGLVRTLDRTRGIIECWVMRDGIDVEGVLEALASAGFEIGDGRDAPSGIDHVFVNSAVDLSGECRGRRHVLQTDYLAPYSWLLAKAVIHATVASVVGDPMMQVSGGGEHQGPVGGGLVAIVREVDGS